MARKSTKKNAPTLEELQAFINGAIEFNEPDWHPDKGQWERIVVMIMNVKFPTVVVPTQQTTTTSQRRLPSKIEHDSSLGEIGEGETLQVGSPKTDMRRQKIEHVGGGEVNPETGAIPSGIKIKPQNRDDSKGLTPSEFL